MAESKFEITGGSLVEAASTAVDELKKAGIPFLVKGTEFFSEGILYFRAARTVLNVENGLNRQTLMELTKIRKEVESLRSGNRSDAAQRNGHKNTKKESSEAKGSHQGDEMKKNNAVPKFPNLKDLEKGK